jgi:hypothetical protein
MKHLRHWLALGIFGLIAAVGSLALPHAQDAGDRGFSGGSYLTTVKDSAGDFASRGVITMHADQTMSVIDSEQGGPTYFFGSQLGSWKPDGNRRVVGRTINFDFPQSPGGVVRGDYTISFAQDRSQVTGTITVTTFPLETNPFDGEGTVLGTFTFVGELIKP